MEEVTIRPELFKVLEDACNGRTTSLSKTEDLLKDVYIEHKRQIEAEAIHKRSQLDAESELAKLIAVGLHSPKGSTMHQIALGYVTGDAAPSRKK